MNLTLISKRCWWSRTKDKRILIGIEYPNAGKCFLKHFALIFFTFRESKLYNYKFD